MTVAAEGTKWAKASQKVEAGRARRAGAAQAQQVRIEWFIKEVSDKVAISMRNRCRLAAQLLKSKVVQNISTPVVKGVGPRGGRRVTGRSKPGEYPHAETAQLMRGIFDGVIERGRGIYDGFVGTPHHYGVILELKMRRSFLVRTLNEMRGPITRILAGPIK